MRGNGIWNARKDKLHVGVRPKKKKIYRTPADFAVKPHHLLLSLSFIIMGRGERDRVNTSLIITKPCVPQPTACAQGLDNQKGLGVPNVPENAKGELMMSQIHQHHDLSQ